MKPLLRPHSKTSASLRTRLLVQLVIIFTILAISLFQSVRYIAGQATDQTQDSILEASVRSIADETFLLDREVTVDIPYSALSQLSALGEDRVFYRVSVVDGAEITGYKDLPHAGPGVPTGQTEFATLIFRDDVFREATRSVTVFTDQGRRSVLITVAQTREAYAAVTSTIARSAAGVGIGFLVLALGLSWLAVGRALRPLSVLEEKLGRRGPHDLTSIKARVPAEVAPLVSSLNRLLRRLRETLDITETFIADAAHRVRTPLAAVKAQAQVALRNTENAKQREALRNMIRATDQTARSTGQLLDHAMVTFRAEKMENKPLDFDALTRMAVRDIVVPAELRDVDVVLTTEPKQIPITGDEVLLFEALRNLLDNAVKYSPPESQVEVAATMSDKGAEVRIKDAGRGLQDTDVDELRQRFKRGSNVEDVVGSGLGLNIVEEVARAHGGYLSLAPNELGGTTVILFIRTL